MDEPEELTSDKCRELLSGGIVGRAAVCTPDGPRIMPVNYAVVDDAIIFRTTPDGVLGRYAPSLAMAFEVDYIDYTAHRGWSVVATGRGEVVDDPCEIERIRSVSAWDPRPWAGGVRDVYVRLAWHELTGRRLGRGWTHDNEMPVRRAAYKPLMK